MMELSSRLRSLRRERGLTLIQVNQKTGLSVSFISDIERGKTNPSLESLNKLAACYNVLINELLEDANTSASDVINIVPPGLEEFLTQVPDADPKIVALMRSSESRALSKNQNAQNWTELYYALKRIYGR